MAQVTGPLSWVEFQSLGFCLAHLHWVWAFREQPVDGGRELSVILPIGWEKCILEFLKRLSYLECELAQQ